MSLLRNIWSQTNYRIAAIFALILTLWLLTGILTANSSDETDNLPTAKSTSEKPRFTVKAKYIDAQTYKANVRISARTKAKRTVNVRAELDGQLISTPAVKGSIVKSGDILCELAAEDRVFRLAEAEAAVATAQLEYDGALRLKTGGFQSKTAIARSKSNLATAKANFIRTQLNVKQLKIRAPFDGIVDNRLVEVGDYIRTADTCATIIELNPLLITAQLSANEIGKIKVGNTATAILMTGETVSGSISYIGRSADDLTRTFPIEVSVANDNYDLISGISAQLQLFTDIVDAHLIPPSLLALDDNGELGLRILNEDYEVRFVNVALIGDDSNGVWVTGLPQRALLITVGQEYVSEGQIVDIALENTTRQEPKNPTASLNP